MNSELDKSAVAKAFSRAASGYDQLAGVQQRVGSDLLQLIPDSVIDNGRPILDLGSGTGFIARYLQQRAVASPLHLVELDIAAGMLAASRRVSACSPPPLCIQADMDRLPLLAQSFQTILSNLSFQWCKSPLALMSDIAQVLDDEGVLIFSTVVDGSVVELKRAWQATNGVGHVNRFFTAQDYIAALESNKFALCECKVVRYKDSFPTITELIDSVRGIGAGNHLANRQPGLLGKNKYRRWLAELKRQTSANSDNSRFELTYEILFVRASINRHSPNSSER